MQSIAGKKNKKKKEINFKQNKRLVYGTALPTIALASHLLLVLENKSPADLLTHVKLNFWCSFSFSLSALMELVIKEEEGTVRKVFRKLLVVMCVLPIALEKRRLDKKTTNEMSQVTNDKETTPLDMDNIYTCFRPYFFLSFLFTSSRMC